jgi:Tfp pilus assembly protein PilO
MKYFFSLLLIAVSITIFVVVIKPQYNELQSTREAVAIANANLETASKLAESRDALIATYNSISKTDLDNLRTLLPDSVDNIRLIIQINSLATKNGLSLLRNVDYQTTQEATAASTLQSPDTTNKPYGEFAVSFQTAGQYKNFLAFLSDLEQNLRLVDVTRIEFAPSDQGVTQSAATSLTYKVTLKTYWLKQ